jgi:predicted site-specific integrase-resolvase
MARNEKLYAVSDAAREVGCSRETIKRYASKGLIRTVAISNGERIYPSSAVSKARNLYQSRRTRPR